MIVCVSIFIHVSHDIKEWIRKSPEGISDHYVDLQTGATTFVFIQSIAGTTCMLSFLKIFKFFRLSNNMNILGRSLYLALGELLAFVVIFSVIFISYSFQGYFLFGSQAKDFHDFLTAIISTFRILSGDSDYEQIQTSNPILAPFFQLSFIVLIILILVNVFIAILNEYYSEAKKESVEKEKEQKEKFMNETEYDLVEQLKGAIPYLRLPRDNKSRRIVQGEFVVIIPSDQGSKEEAELANLLGDKVKMLVMKSNVLDHRYIFELIKGKSLIHFSSNMRNQLSLAPRDYREILQPEYISIHGRKVNTKKLVEGKEAMLLVYESLSDVTLDEHLHIHFESINFNKLFHVWSSSFWISRMTVEPQAQFFTHSQMQRILRRMADYYAFHDCADSDIELFNGEKLLMDLKELKKKDPAAFAGLSASEILRRVQKKQSEKSIMLLKENLVREIQIDHVLSHPERLDRFNYADLCAEADYIMSLFPPSCSTKVTKRELISNFRPKPMTFGGITNKMVEIMGEHQDSIAEYIHDIWAYGKLRNEWKYGPKRNDKEKIHHQLVPYNELQEKEKSYDRNIARKVVAMILQWGFSIINSHRTTDYPLLDVSKYMNQVSPGYIPRLPNIPENDESIKKLGPLLEVLAESIHDEWCKTRFGEGKVYGDDSANGKLIDLVPYQLLDGKVKQSNRDSVVAVFKFFIWKGYEVKERKKESKFIF